MATVVAYAARSAVVHGHWARFPDSRRPHARAAEEWLWNVVEREIERTLVATRLPQVRMRLQTVTSM